MSGSTLSFTANRPSTGTAAAPSVGQEINSLAAAAAAVAAASTVASTVPDTTAGTPASMQDQRMDPDTPVQAAAMSSSGEQSSRSFASETFASDAKPCLQSAAENEITPEHMLDDQSATTAAMACNPAITSDSVGLESSLLLNPFSGMAASTNPDASMATPQSLQDVASTSLSPLDMLIAALDPQKQQQQQQKQSSVVAFPSADSGDFGNDYGGAGYGTMPWSNTSEAGAAPVCLQDVSRRASDAAIFDGYQLGKPLNDGGGNNGSSGGNSMVSQPDMLARTPMRKGSYPPGIKRPFSDFDHLLSAADLYASNQMGAVNGLNPNGTSTSNSNGGGSAFSQVGDHSGPPAIKHARHDSLFIDTGARMVSAEPSLSSADASAASNIPFTAATFPCSTRRSTVFGEYFDPLSSAGHPSAGIHVHHSGGPLISEPPTGINGSGQAACFDRSQQQQQHYRSLSLSHIDYQNPPGLVGHQQNLPGGISMAQHVPASSMPMPMSMSSTLQMTSPLAAAAAASAAAAGMGGGNNGNPAMGYFYDGMAMGGGLIGGGSGGGGCGDVASSVLFSPAPIPAIPGVTVSPKEKPRRLSVPDLTPTKEEERGGPKARPRGQKVRFKDDMYTPMWVRSNGQQKEGFCDTCAPGKWLQLKNSAFWYHKQFFHGISSVSGRPFVRPLQVRHYDADIIEGLCHQCRQWVPIANAKRRNSVLWFRHAHKCHVYHKPKQEHDAADAKD
ncbi:hypothetical protein LPJ72_000301 [Coemansia sp. Benny D160-2]|nr:hypothetical protein LPJ72_000301 [Coemansia sp. Benny D160-2]